jgi:iron complex transport system permease protein
VSVFALPVFAFLSATLTLLLVFVLAGRGSGAPSVYSIILSGVILSAICSSILMFLVSTASTEGLHSVIWWMLGSLQPASYELLGVVTLLVFSGSAASMVMARDLNALTMGREIAHHIGIQPKTVIVAGLGIATVVTASAVSISGLIGFVGLIVPHVMRAIVGPDHRRLLPAVAVGGGAFLSLCDAIARSAIQYEIPVGVITALFGGPFFLMILARRRKQGWIE